MRTSMDSSYPERTRVKSSWCSSSNQAFPFTGPQTLALLLSASSESLILSIQGTDPNLTIAILQQKRARTKSSCCSSSRHATPFAAPPTLALSLSRASQNRTLFAWAAEETRRQAQQLRTSRDASQPKGARTKSSCCSSSSQATSFTGSKTLALIFSAACQTPIIYV